MGERVAAPKLLKERFFFVGLGATAVIVAAFGSSAVSLLGYRRAAVDDGEVWRLVTSVLVHVDLAHLAWNLAGTAIVAVAVGPALSARSWGVATAASAVGAGLGVHLLSPRVLAMLGLSGVLHGLLAAGAWRAARGGPARRRERGGECAGWVLLALLLLKLLLERAGPLPWSAAVGERVAVDSHLYGSLAGFVSALFLERRQAA